MKMVGDIGRVFLTTVACLQLAVSTDPADIAYVDDALQRSYLANPLIETPTAALARYLSNDGL